jgi:ornithine carbamoyltransferase
MTAIASKRDVVSITDLTPAETRQVIERAMVMKHEASGQPLRGVKFALLFEKPSLRTKVSFQVGIEELGGYSTYLGPDEVGLGTREPVSDVARVLSGYVDGIIARVFSHEQLQELARYASVPVINALSDWEHPCQTLADLLTIREHKGPLSGLKLAFIGDGNNVARSLCLGLPPLGVSFAIASPAGYQLDEATLQTARAAAGEGAQVSAVTAPAGAVRDADVVYTDVWTSMGDEAESAQRRADFQGYTVDETLLALAKPGAGFMHDMPAHYGEEVAPGMLEHPQSLAYPQAHNRLHAQKALLELICGHG